MPWYPFVMCSACAQWHESTSPSNSRPRLCLYAQAYRDNDRVSVDDASQASSLWRSLGLEAVFRVQEGHDACGCATGLNPNLRFYRYSPGQRFGRHVDDSADVGGGTTRFTLLVYLSTPRGGDTVFHLGRRKSIAVGPRAGLALLHRHGDACLEHEALAVVAGQKYVLRSDVVFRT